MSHRSPRVKTVAHDGHPRTRVRSSGFQTDSKASGPLVLLVEDYKDTRDMYAQFLRYSGFRVEEARDGVEAIEKAAQFSPDIILMDLALPRMDGWEATRQLKASRVTSGIPIVALTGHALAAHEERARRAGCDAFLAKPCTPDSVVDAIHRILRH